MNDPQLQQILESKDKQRCLEFFREMGEQQRRNFAPQCILRYEELSDGTQWDLLRVSEMAVLATATLSETRKPRLRGMLGWEVLVADVLNDRQVSWAGDFADDLLEDACYWSIWPTVHRMVRVGLIDRPEHPNYYLGMITGLVGEFNSEGTVEQRLLAEPDLLDVEIWKLFEYEGGGVNSLANFDRYCRCEGNWLDAFVSLVGKGTLPRQRVIDCTMQALQQDFNHYRAGWFLKLHDALNPTADEEVAHADAYLHLLGMSASNVVSWAFKKVEKLAKSDTYRPDALVAGVKPVLATGGKGIIKRTLKLLSRIAAETPDCRTSTAAAATAALSNEDADVQQAALDVIDAAGDEDDTKLRYLLADHAQLVAPSLQDRLRRWVGVETDELDRPDDDDPSEDTWPSGDFRMQDLYSAVALQDQPRGDSWEIPAAIFSSADLPQLAVRRPVVAIEDLDELLDVCSQVIENSAGVDDVERALDGLSRLCDRRDEDFGRRIASLLKRIENILKSPSFTRQPFVGDGPDADMLGLVHAWATGKPAKIGPVGEYKTGSKYVPIIIGSTEHTSCTDNMDRSIGFLSRRSYAISLRLARGEQSPLLSAPTHEGGWIDPIVLAERVNAWTRQAPDVTDVVLAMLRCAPQRRDEALDVLKASKSEWVRAIRYSLGGSERLGKTTSLWATAACARSPWTQDDKIARAMPDIAPLLRQDNYDVGYVHRICKYDDNTTIESDRFSITPMVPHDHPEAPDCLPLVLQAERSRQEMSSWELGGIGGPTEQSIRWMATTWPAARESFFAAAAVQLAENIDWETAYWQNKALLEPMLDPGTPLRSMGTLLLAIGLACKEPGEYGLATDIAIAAVKDGRLGSDNLAQALTTLLPTGLVKPGRWHRTLGEVARISPAHAAVVILALEKTLTGSPDDMPRNFGKLIVLLRELCADLQHGISTPNAREFLRKFKGQGLTAKAAKALLQIETSSPSFKMLKAIKSITRMRIAAAWRWYSSPKWKQYKGSTQGGWPG